VQLAIVLNEAQFPELVHEEIHSRARCPDHFRQHFLRDFREYVLKLVFRAIASEQKKNAGQPFLAGVKEMIDQILFDANIPRKQIADETVGESMFRVEYANHLSLFNDE